MSLKNILTSDSPNVGRGKINDNNEAIPKLIDAVSGGNGFQSVAGTAAMELDPLASAGGRAFLHTITGDTEFDFLNIPSSNGAITFWFWALKMDVVGGHAVTFNRTLHPLNGERLSDLNDEAEALNLAQFFYADGKVFWHLLYTGRLRVGDLDFSFSGDETQFKSFDRDYQLDLNNVRHLAPGGGAASGNLQFELNGSPASGLINVAENQVLSVIRLNSSAGAAVSVPWYIAA